MRALTCLLLLGLLLILANGCSSIRAENPLKLKCPSCGYIWELTPTEEY